MYKRNTDVCRKRNKKKHLVGRWMIISALFIFGFVVVTLLAQKESARESEISVTQKSVLLQVATAENSNVKAQKMKNNVADQAQTGTDKHCVIIDPGHGGYDVGSSKGNILEKDINLQISLKLRDKLEGMGYEVILTREDDSHVSLSERVVIANELEGDIFISIHQNSFDENYVKGLETWYSGGRQTEHLYRSAALGDDSQRLAKLLHYDMLSGTNANDRGVRNGELWVTSMTRMPSCLIEPGFISNKEERSKLLSVAYQEKIVGSIAESIERFFATSDMHLILKNVEMSDNTTVVLDILKERNVKAFFWVNAKTVQAQPRALERLVKEGHEIGLYCDIPEYNISESCIDDLLADFGTAYRKIYELTGEKVKVFTFSEPDIDSDNGNYGVGSQEQAAVMSQVNKKRIISAMTARGGVYLETDNDFSASIGEEDTEIMIQNIRDNEKIIMPVRVDVYGVGHCLDEVLWRYPQYKFDILNQEMENIRITAIEDKTEEAEMDSASGNE